MEKSKILYFSVFILVVIAFIFHVNAMGHHHWKKAISKNFTSTDVDRITIGLFTRCRTDNITNAETCNPNRYPRNTSCSWDYCNSRFGNENCQCDYSSPTKGIAACSIIASIFLGLAIIILFIHSIKTTENRSIGLILGLNPLISLLLAFIFILITLILVGSYLSRDVMYMLRDSTNTEWANLRQNAADKYDIRVDWSTGLEIIALIITFFSLILYSIFVFKLGRS